MKEKNPSLSRFGGASPNRPNGETAPDLDIFLRWKNAVLQMLETCFSKERLLSKSMPRFLADGEEFTEQPSSITTPNQKKLGQYGKRK